MKGGVMTHDELADKVRELERQLAHAQRERDHWKTSYQDMVAELSKALERQLTGFFELTLSATIRS
jgi:hypothetical protein